ncbi:AMP-dependent synthetase/ligase [Lolliginicoccus suaedae]|uniref:AMP-dependent synthetase/ligase n=1 Tax=Lolliginicoccus suaedae TaxID=2605429 RepID=UPI0011EF2A60|nr:long-chain fatty acid--CoA ligase [Lolliginicoccus suaedae]
MREMTVPPAQHVEPGDSLTDMIVRNAITDPTRIAFQRQAEGDWIDVTAAGFLREVDDLAKGLIASGILPGDRVALLSRTRYEWTLCDFAIWSAGAITVPIYETSSAEQIQWILSDSGAVACIAETPALALTVATVLDSNACDVWQIEGPATEPARPLAVLRDLGTGLADDTVALRRAGLSATTTATLIYTSGTTGRPKGCALTHGHFLGEVTNVTAQLADVFDRPGSATLLFLPLAHVFARVIQLGCVHAGVVLGHSSDIKTLLDDLAAFQPTFILAVPRVFEKVYNGAARKADAAGKGTIFARATATAIAYSEAIDDGRITWPLRARHKLYDVLVYRKLRATLGGQATHAISGGSPLGARLGHFYRGIGLTVLEGYGLTETTAAITVNPPAAPRMGTVGQPVPGTTIRIAEDGEVLARGPMVFGGYWNNDAATAEALDADGWFHTGDIGTLDEDGYLAITGRKKELIVTAGGKNVAPAVIEDRIRAHPLISQVMVVGDNEPFVGALITLDAEALEPWALARGKTSDIAGLIEDAELRAEIDSAIAEGNKAVSKAESVRAYRIVPLDWTVEDGQLTPSMKLKRAIVAKEHAADIEALYGR